MLGTKFFDLLRPAIFALDPETGHRLAIATLKSLPRAATAPNAGKKAALSVDVAGLAFPNPVGVAAGFDKDAEVPDALLALGFGAAEVGSITPRPQPGNTRPRLFRLVEDKAVINRMGFNNRGAQAALDRLSKRERDHVHGILGVNVGANKDSENRIDDYLRGIADFAPYADYITVNISSPNTPGLRNLQAKGELEALLEAISADRRDSDPPIFLKVAPDLEQGDHERIVKAALDNGVAALIVSNTTISRPVLRSRHAGEAGGLSGEPLKGLALEQLRRFRAVSGAEIPLVGVGGITNAHDAWERIRAGASLVQLYSAMVFHGPTLGAKIASGLQELMRRDGFATIAEAVGSE